MLLLVFSVWSSWRALSIFTGGVVFETKKVGLQDSQVVFDERTHTGRDHQLLCGETIPDTKCEFLGKHSFLSKGLLLLKPMTFACFKKKVLEVRLPFLMQVAVGVCGLLDSNTLAKTEGLTTSKRGENLPAPVVTNLSGTPPPRSTFSVHTVFSRVLN